MCCVRTMQTCSESESTTAPTPSSSSLALSLPHPHTHTHTHTHSHTRTHTHTHHHHHHHHYHHARINCTMSVNNPHLDENIRYSGYLRMYCGVAADDLGEASVLPGCRGTPAAAAFKSTEPAAPVAPEGSAVALLQASTVSLIVFLLCVTSARTRTHTHTHTHTESALRLLWSLAHCAPSPALLVFPGECGDARAICRAERAL
jgi:hypothetical protein